MVQKTIPVQIREGVSPDIDLENKLAKLYNQPVAAFKTQRGEWKIHSRRDVKVPESEESRADGFFAVYYKKGKPESIMCGDKLPDSTLEATLNHLTKNILEEPRFRKPSRYFAADRSPGPIMAYGSLMLAGFGGIFYGMVTSPEIARSLVGLCPLLGFSTFAVNAVSKKIGRMADLARVKELPAEAKSFSYGYDAQDRLKKEYLRLYPSG